MEDRIRTLERRQWIGMAAFALLFVATLLGMSDDRVSDQIKVKQLQVVDDHGRVVVEMKASELGGSESLSAAALRATVVG